MKILYLITKGNWGGAQKYVFTLANEAQNKGWETAIVLGEGEGLETKLIENNLRVIKLPHLGRNIKIWSDLQTFFDLIKLFKQERPDIIHLNSSKIGGLGALAGRLARVPKIIFTGHGWAFNEDRFLLSRWLIALSHWVTILLCHQVIAVSTQTAKQIAVFPKVKPKIKVIYNGIEKTTFLTKKEARQKLVPEDADTFWLGTIAELHQNKGLDILIEAFKKVLEKISGVSLIIIGEGEAREKLAHLIAKNQLTENIHLLGRRENAAQYLLAFDIFILPSRTEALPYVILEAGLAGLPVVASRVGGIPEIIENEVSGFLINPGNYKDLSLAMEKLLTNKDLAHQFGKNLKEKVITQFSQAKMLDQTFALYQK